MKKISISFITMLLIITAILFPSILNAQESQKMSYQILVKDNNNKLVLNNLVGIKVSIIHNTSNEILYSDTLLINTNAIGIANIEFGGNINLDSIKSKNGPYTLRIETDPWGGTQYFITETMLLNNLNVLYNKTSNPVNETSKHYIGELYGGGIVFWTDSWGQHGLVMSMIDLSKNQVWSNMSTSLIGATTKDGYSNSLSIIHQKGHTNSAAQLCLDYVNEDYGSGIFNDWYLPSLDELKKLWRNIELVQDILKNDNNPSTFVLEKKYYWSSTESDGSDAFYLYFFNGFSHYDYKDGLAYVRAIRSF